MLNPFYFKTIHEYYQLRAKLADDTVLSRLETAKLKRMMNKNSEFKSLNKEEKKIAYQEYLALVHYLWLGRPSPIFVLD